MRFYWLIVGVLAVWRVTHLFSMEDGPWNLLVRLRQFVGRNVFGQLMDCFYCLSLWTGLPFALVIGGSWKERLMLWPALSAGAILCERMTTRNFTNPTADVPTPTYFEDPEEDHVLRTR
jgi:hypothetical protein